MEKEKELTPEEAKNAAKEFITKKLQEVKQELEISNEVKPSIILLTYYLNEEKVSAITLPDSHLFFESELTKKLIKPRIMYAADKLREAGKTTRETTNKDFQYQLLAVIILSDTFYYTMPKDEPKGDYIRPSQHPEKKEAVACLVSLKGENFAEVHPYIRVDDIILFEQRVDMENAEHIGGNLINLYPANA